MRLLLPVLIVAELLSACSSNAKTPLPVQPSCAADLQPQVAVSPSPGQRRTAPHVTRPAPMPVAKVKAQMLTNGYAGVSRVEWNVDGYGRYTAVFPVGNAAGAELGMGLGVDAMCQFRPLSDEYFDTAAYYGPPQPEHFMSPANVRQYVADYAEARP